MSDAKQAQEERAKKYGIAVKDGGNVTKPGEWSSVPDEDWLDPVNYRYPCPDDKQTRAAAAYWGKPKDKEQYSSEERGIIDKRLAKMEKKFKIGDSAKGAGSDEEGNTMIRASSVLSEAVGDQASPDFGYKWQVQIVDAGTDHQGIANYPLAVIQAATPLYEGAKVFALSQGQHADPANPYGKSVRDIVGWLSDVGPNATGIGGVFNIVKSASWLRDMIADAWTRGKKDLVGLSHDVLAKTASTTTRPKNVERIIRVDSVDVVYDPIAGGKILRMAAAMAGRKKEEDEMLEKLLAALRQQRPDLYRGIEAKVNDKTITEDEVIALMGAGMKAPDTETGRDGDTETRRRGDAKKEKEEAQRILQETRLVACSLILKDELRESGLPEISQAKIRKQFEAKVFETEFLRAAVKEEKEYLDKLTGSGVVTGLGNIRVENAEPEKVQAALDKLFGVEVDAKYKEVEPFRSLRAAYTRITGDSEVRGVPSRDGQRFGESYMEYMRLPAAYGSASFSYVLGNTLYRRMVQDYRAVDYQEGTLISFKRNARDFKTMESVRIGYFGDLPDVDPETADYAEATMVTDEEISYSLNQKGVILTITRKVIINDDLRSVQALVSRLGRAARRTFARRGWNKIVNNATYKADSIALFHANHGNLGATTLTNDATGIATLTARLVAMFSQTEKDAGEKLGIEPKYLWVPRELLEIAKALNSPWPIAGTVNPHAGRFGTNQERIICLKLTTDPNDWGLIASSDDVELLEVAFLNGQEEPELFVADNPLVGQMFTADKLQYKQRHEYEWEIADYRGFDKAVV